MLNLTRDVQAGLVFLKPHVSKQYRIIGYSSPFSRTNEDICDYFYKFPIKDGCVLTVTGSGDNILQSSLYGPKEIYGFDRNPFALYMSMLKVGACLALEYNAFEEYFDDSNINFFNIDYYKKIRDYLDDECKYFWDSLYKQDNYEYLFRLFIQPGNWDANRGINSYENIDNYYLTKENISNILIHYYNLELFEVLKNKENIKFSSIFLSNIYDWIRKSEKVKYHRFVKHDLCGHLTDDGIIASYSPVKGEKLYNKLDKVYDDIMYTNDHNKVYVYKKINK